MPKFKVLARDSSGNRVHQALEAVNQAEARAQLRSRNLTILSIVEEAGRGGKGPPAACAGAPRSASDRRAADARAPGRFVGAPLA